MIYLEIFKTVYDGGAHSPMVQHWMQPEGGCRSWRAPAGAGTEMQLQLWRGAHSWAQICESILTTPDYCLHLRVPGNHFLDKLVH